MKKFACNHCDKSFSRRDYLERHSANHLTVKPFVCTPCNRSFARSDLYENHLITKFHIKRAGSSSSSPESSPPSNNTVPALKPVGGGVQKVRRSSPTIPSIPILQDQNHLALTPSLSPISQTPAAAASSPENHSWLLFEDGREDWGSRHYDRIYSSTCDEVAQSWSQLSTSPTSLAMSILVGNDKSLHISQFLKTHLSPLQISKLIDLCWTCGVCSTGVFIHRPTFDADNQSSELLATMTLVGMYHDGSYKQELKQLFNNAVESFDTTSELGNLQAFALLKWLEFELGENTNKLDTSKVLAPHKSDHRSAVDEYRFANDSVQEWQKWINYESRKRTMHFVVYCEYTYASAAASTTSSSSLETLHPHNVFDIDTHMPFPEQLWEATNKDDFFAISGPDSSIKAVPYLFVVRSMLRLPKLGEEQQNQKQQLEECRNWSPIALTMVLYAFLDISRACANNTGYIARLSRGLNLWKRYFDSSVGPVKIVDQSPKRVHPGSIFTRNSMALLLMRYHKARIMIHEDIQLVKQVSTKMPSWAASTNNDLSSLFETDRYSRWSRTNEAKDAVSIASLYLYQASTTLGCTSKAITSLVDTTTFHAVLIIWLYELFNGTATSSTKTLVPTNSASQFLGQLWSRISSLVTPPATPPPANASFGDDNNDVSCVVALGRDLLSHAGNTSGGRVMNQLLEKHVSIV